MNDKFVYIFVDNGRGHSSGKISKMLKDHGRKFGAITAALMAFAAILIYQQYRIDELAAQIRDGDKREEMAE